MSDRAYLTVPFAEKDAAKALGARWDPVAKQWFAPPNVDHGPLARWMPGGSPVSTPSSTPNLANNGAGGVATAPASSWGAAPPSGLRAAGGQQTGQPAAMPPGAMPIATRGGDPNLAGLAQSNPLSLALALQRASNAVTMAFPAPLWIQAEVDSVRRNNTSGHWYLELTERDGAGKKLAGANARVWKSDERVLAEFEKQTGTPLREGLRALFLIKFDFSPQFGMGARILRLDPSWTLGEMQKKLLQIRQALKDAGIADNNRKLPAPVDYSRVALIAPSQAAGLGDFMADARKLEKNGLCTFELFEATFEGASAVDTLMRAFTAARKAHERNPFDALVIIRGGGASASLSWLNELPLAQATALFPVPVLAGIGHERDKTAIDEVARVSLDTPSKVIGLIVTTIVNNAQKAMNDFKDVVALARSGVQKADAQSDEAWTLFRSESMRAATRAQTACETLAAEIARETRFAVRLAEERTQALSKEVLGLGPRQTIARGYAMVREGGPEGRLISRASDAKNAETLYVSFADGGLAARPVAAAVGDYGVQSAAPAAMETAPKTRAPRSKKAVASAQAADVEQGASAGEPPVLQEAPAEAESDAESMAATPESPVVALGSETERPDEAKVAADGEDEALADSDSESDDDADGDDAGDASESQGAPEAEYEAEANAQKPAGNEAKAKTKGKPPAKAAKKKPAKKLTKIEGARREVAKAEARAAARAAAKAQKLRAAEGSDPPEGAS